MNSLIYITGLPRSTTIQVTATVFSVVHVEYRAIALLGLFCGSRSNSVRINTRLTIVVWRTPHQYPVTIIYSIPLEHCTTMGLKLPPSYSSTGLDHAGASPLSAQPSPSPSYSSAGLADAGPLPVVVAVRCLSRPRGFSHCCDVSIMHVHASRGGQTGLTFAR